MNTINISHFLCSNIQVTALPTGRINSPDSLTHAAPVYIIMYRYRYSTVDYEYSTYL